jgi:hypothetical protein
MPSTFIPLDTLDALRRLMMHIDIIAVSLRNILFFQLMMVLVLAGNTPLVPQELLKIWKTLNTPLLPKRPGVTNHKSNKFWEIDMTKLEP